VFKLAPPAAVYLVPFSFGTIQEARLAWRIVLVVVIVAAWVILARALGLPALGWAWLLGLATWSLFGPLQIAVGEGQWDPIFLLLLAIATHAVVEGRATLAAVAVAVAASVKPYPLLLVGYFLARRAWREAAVTLATLVTLLVAGALVVGLDETAAFVTRILPASGATTAYADNQALGGVIARAWTSDLKPFPLHDAGAVDLTIRVVALALFGMSIWLVGRQAASDGQARALQLGLFVPLSILVIPAAWTHYQAILLVPLTVLAVDQARNRPREPVGWLLLGAAYAVLLLPNPTMLYGPEIDRGLWLRSRADGANLALQRLYPTGFSRLILSYKAFAVILLYGLLAWRVARPAARGVGADTPSPRVTIPAGGSS
jgi:alpha-1,2-mannosyltransferase